MIGEGKSDRLTDDTWMHLFVESDQWTEFESNHEGQSVLRGLHRHLGFRRNVSPSVFAPLSSTYNPLPPKPRFLSSSIFRSHRNSSWQPTQGEKILLIHFYFFFSVLLLHYRVIGQIRSLKNFALLANSTGQFFYEQLESICRSSSADTSFLFVHL